MFTDKDDIERELTLAMNVRPGAEFESRVLEAAAGSAPARRLRLMPWLAAAAMLFVALGAWRAMGRPATPAAEPVVAALEGTRSAPSPALPPTVVGTDTIRRPDAARSARPGRLSDPVGSGGLRRSRPEVIVPANQLALIHRFARELEAGRVQFAEAPEPQAVLRRLVVPEVIIDPIAVVSLEPGTPPGPKGLQ